MCKFVFSRLLNDFIHEGLVFVQLGVVQRGVGCFLAEFGKDAVGIPRKFLKHLKLVSGDL